MPKKTLDELLKEIDQKTKECAKKGYYIPKFQLPKALTMKKELFTPPKSMAVKRKLPGDKSFKILEKNPSNCQNSKITVNFLIFFQCYANSRTTRYMRISILSKKKLKYILSLLKETYDRSMFYTRLRGENEQFRRQLVDFICNKKAKHTEDHKVIAPEDQEYLRFQYYVKMGIDTVHIAELDEKVVKKV